MNDLDKKLLHAVKSGNPKLISTLISKGANVNVYSDDISSPGGRFIAGYTPLMFSVRGETERRKCLEILIQNNADVNLYSVDNHKTTALILAAGMLGDLDSVRCLIENGADIDMMDSNQRTALLSAAYSDKKDKVQIIKYLLEHGANINKQDMDGYTPLMALVLLEKFPATILNLEAILCFLEFGADSSLESKSRENAIQHEKLKLLEAYQKEGLDECRSIIKSKAADEQLIVAVRNRNYKKMESAIDQGADINLTIDNLGNTPLLLAAEEGNILFLNLLIEKGVDINYSPPIKKTTPLIKSMHRASRHNLEFPLALIKYGVNVNEIICYSGRRKETALTCVCKDQKWHYIWALVENGADVNFQGYLGNTPLMFLFSGCSDLLAQQSKYYGIKLVELVELFIKSGANLLIKNNKKETVIDLIAKHKNCSPIVADLIISQYEQQLLNQDVIDSHMIIEPVTVRFSLPNSGGFTIPDSPIPTAASLQLDMNRVTELKNESKEVTKMLAALFEQDAASETSMSIQMPANEPMSDDKGNLLGLDNAHSNLIKLLCSRIQWSRVELEEIASSAGMMLDGALEHINEATYDTFDVALTEGNDPIDINQNILKELLK